ncbi:MAG: glycine cleavage system aminomethyltransferase GcvT [Candidatus Omnitrophota bacterium]
MKKTPFYQKHLQNKGRIVDFCGWALPLEYQSALQEAKQVRSICGLFDASHMGEIIIQGPGSFDFLQRLASNDISLLKTGQMQYNLFLNKSGGVIDDLMVYKLKNGFMCVVNASNKDKVFTWLNKNNNQQAEIIDISDITALISIQGPNSAAIVNKVFGKKIADLNYMSFFEGKIEGVDKEAVVSRSGYTGEDGFEVYICLDDAVYWWDKIVEEGKNFGLMLCGLGSRDILRIEAGYPLYGHEINDEINPCEAGLNWAVKLNKNLIGREEILKVKNQGIRRKRIGFIMRERAFPRQGFCAYSRGKEIGEVSSAAFSPNLNSFIGMAYIEKDFAVLGNEVQIKVREKLYKAKIVKYPFITPKTRAKIGGNNERVKIY